MSPQSKSQARNAFLFFNCARDRIEPIVVEISDWPGELILVQSKSQFVAADAAELLKWNFALA